MQCVSEGPRCWPHGACNLVGRQPGIELFNKYLLSTCSVPGTVLSDGDSEINKMDVLSDNGVELLMVETGKK